MKAWLGLTALVFVLAGCTAPSPAPDAGQIGTTSAARPIITGSEFDGPGRVDAPPTVTSSTPAVKYGVDDCNATTPADNNQVIPCINGVTTYEISAKNELTFRDGQGSFVIVKPALEVVYSPSTPTAGGHVPAPFVIYRLYGDFRTAGTVHHVATFWCRDNRWERVANPNDRTFSPGEVTALALTWYDSSKPPTTSLNLPFGRNLMAVPR